MQPAEVTSSKFRWAFSSYFQVITAIEVFVFEERTRFKGFINVWTSRRIVQYQNITQNCSISDSMISFIKKLLAASSNNWKISRQVEAKVSDYWNTCSANIHSFFLLQLPTVVCSRCRTLLPAEANICIAINNCFFSCNIVKKCLGFIPKTCNFFGDPWAWFQGWYFKTILKCIFIANHLLLNFSYD